ncbi:MAG: hypothetical protein R3B93_26910 [Bacteroidia bacterium]
MATLIVVGCKKEDPPPIVDPPVIITPKDTTTLGDGPVDFSKFLDTYGHLANPGMTSQWAHYNVHDPSYLVDDEFTYCYNTGRSL